MLHEIIVIVHVLLCVSLIGLILIQHGKGADAGAAFGGGASGTVFGSQGATSFLSRTTSVLATLFFVTSLSLAYFSIQRIDKPKSILESAPQEIVIDSEVPNTETIKSTIEVPPVDNEVPTNKEVPSVSSEVPQVPQP
jgi:preprotein translocase subunit SecG